MMVKSWTSEPMARPDFARTSSAASGLRFCGMMLEPVDHASDIRTNPNWADDQITISSARRERCCAQIATALSASSAKSRALTQSSEFAIGRSKPSAFAVMWRSMGKPVPASAAAPSGLSFMRTTASVKRPRSRSNIST